MTSLSRTLLAVAGIVFSAQVAAQATFYEHTDFGGQTVRANQEIPRFDRYSFNDRTSSVEIVGNRWEVCEHSGFQGRCVVLRPGKYPSLADMGLNDQISSARAIANNARVDDDRYAPAVVNAQITFYEREGFDGRSFTTTGAIPNFRRYGFNDRASSAVVVGERWEVCENNRYRGRCVVLRPGRYPSLASMGLDDEVTSVRTVAGNVRIADNRYAPAPGPVRADGQVTFYERAGFQGRSFTTEEAIANLERAGFNDRASSAVVVGERWEVCEDNRYRGRCVVLRPGRYPSLASMGLDDEVTSVRTVAGNARIADNRYAPAPGPARVDGQVTFFERAGFQGRSFTTEEAIANLERAGFNDRATSAIVIGERWEVCNDTRYSGRCVVLRPGRYPSLEAMGMNDRISSVRTVEGSGRIDSNRYAPQPVPVYDSRRRDNERLFEAPVTSVRAVLATSGQRCWVEREQVQGGNANVPAALAGALIGGILGHQVGGGSGKDIATVGGVIAGAALGAQVGRDGQPATQDVRRCENIPGGAQPAFWDVSYSFRGQDHRVQMASDPGRTITVNEQGEPRQQQ
ncbi:MAG: beta/gamma crystallin-related protein [Hydrogenophaga sp.]|uniref:beta/gamma crystallin-related protein n=1 Tax=Hydrogenophaga sp. TaxID=1904254 RepID=UPI002730AD2C|nr:beta/gamma crystallin-related protein [Hydrogenophaga sp.]MDP2405301.1 beta/gamma crystallin-related protein [Hydrogenophaga sp.]